MADFSLQDQWWNKPDNQESALPALALGAQIVEKRAQQDLQERELANQMSRTAIMRDTQISKLAIQSKLDVGNSEMAKAIAGVTDWTDDEQVSKVWETGSKHPMTVGGKAWLGAQHMVESARTAKRLEEEARSRIASRSDRAALNTLIEQRRSLLADSTIDLNDARIAKYDKDIALEERRLLVGEGNLAARKQDLNIKEKRFDAAKWSPEDRIEFNRRSKVIDDTSALSDDDKDLAIQEIRADIEGKRQQQEKFDKAKTAREGLKTNAPHVVAPQPIAPENNPRAAEIRASLQAGKITRDQALEQLRELGFK